LRESGRFVERTVLLVEDFEPFRDLVRSRLQLRPEFRIVGEVSDGADAVSVAETLTPDLVITDIGLPSVSGLVLARVIRRVSSDCKIIFLTQDTASELVNYAFDIGADGFVAKFDVAELIPAIDAVFNGKKYVSRTVSATLDDLPPPTL
jgi:DNA-binding NarL/FixJ family response regulator